MTCTECESCSEDILNVCINPDGEQIEIYDNSAAEHCEVFKRKVD